jgi:beta-lactamase class A
VLQQVQERKLSLGRKLVLQPTDKIDGSGGVVWQKDGTAFTVGSLLERMLMQSDNTAANMLLRAAGEDDVNARARAWLGDDLGRITNFTQVRREVYAQLHPGADKLSNLQLVQIAAAPQGPARVNALRRVLALQQADLKVSTMEEAYARYYARRHNTATLTGYGAMLEKMVRGQLLSPEHTRLMFTRLKYETYDAYRLEAGLPSTVRFIHKTGTQLGRACHMGVIEPQDGARRAIVVAVCAEALDEQREAGEAFERIGKAIAQVLLQPQAGRP